MPGILYSCIVGYVAMIYRNYEYNHRLWWTMIILNAINCIYFATEACKSYQKHSHSVVCEKTQGSGSGSLCEYTKTRLAETEMIPLGK